MINTAGDESEHQLLCVCLRETGELRLYSGYQDKLRSSVGESGASV